MAEHDNHDRRLEEMLDSMLSNYSDEQPRPGLETRVLATLRAQSAQKQDRAPFWRWLWSGAAALALVAIALAFYIGRLQTPPAPPVVGGVMKPPPVATPVPGDRSARTAARHPARHEQAQEPATALMPPLAISARPEVFPSLVPLTDQEKLLLRYLAGTSKEEVVAQSHSDDPPPDDGGPLLPQVREFRRTDVFSTR